MQDGDDSAAARAKMQDGDDSAAAAATEAALGLSPQVFVDEVLDIIADVSAEAFEYCLQLRSLRILLSRIPAPISPFVSVFSLTPSPPTGRACLTCHFAVAFLLQGSGRTGGPRSRHGGPEGCGAPAGK